MYELAIPGPSGAVVIRIDGEYVIVAYGWQSVTTGGSPTFVTADPPIGPIDTINLGEIYRTIVDLLNG